MGILSSFLILGSLNPISRLALLIMVFLMASFQFLILDFYFLGLTYIIVYVGAIAILFLFVIMLIQTDMVGISSTPLSQGGIRTTSSSLMGGSKSNLYTFEGATNLGLTDLMILDTSNKRVQSESWGESISEAKIYTTKESSFGPIIFSFLTFIGALILGYITLFDSSILNVASTSGIFASFFYPAWTTDLFTLTDIQALGFTLYLGFPIAIVILGIILWIVLIGILTLSSQL